MQIPWGHQWPMCIDTQHVLHLKVHSCHLLLANPCQLHNSPNQKKSEKWPMVWECPHSEILPQQQQQQHQNHDHYLSIQIILQLGDAIRKQFVNFLLLFTMPLKWHWHTDDPQSVVYNSEREGSEPASSGIPCVFCWYIWEITKTASGTICSLAESMKRSMMPAIFWTICVIAFKLVSYSEAQIRTCFERKLWPPNCTKLDWSSDSWILQCLLSDRKYKMQAALLSHTTQGGAKQQESLLNKDAY